MAEHELDRIESFEKQLRANPPAVIRKHTDRLEAFLLSIETEQTYSWEYIYFKVTGFRPVGEALAQYKGEEIRPQLQKLLDRLSECAPALASEVPEKLHTLKDLSERLDVSLKTLYRWRRNRGLVSRKYQFDDGRIRTAVRQEALDRFLRENESLILHSSQFARLNSDEAEKMREMGKRLMARGYSLTAAAHRIAGDTGRAVETVRMSLKSMQEEENDQVPRGRGLSGEIRDRIYTEYNEGQTAATLSRRYGRSRSSIYRIINEMRARELLWKTKTMLPTVVEDCFDDNGAEEALVERLGVSGYAGEDVFRFYNYLKYKIGLLGESVDLARYVRSGLLDDIECCLAGVHVLRAHLLAEHMPLIFAVAAQHSGSVVGMNRLFREGCECFLQSIDEYNYRRMGGFASFVRLRLMKNYARTVPEEHYNGMASKSDGKRISPGFSYEDRLVVLREGIERIRRAQGGVSEGAISAARRRFTLPEVPCKKAVFTLGRQLKLSEDDIKRAYRHSANSTSP
jgi:AraC-like DNA-binding protein